WQEADDALTLYRLTSKKTITDKEASSLAPDTFQKLVDQREKNTPTFKEIFDIVYEKDLSKLSKSAKTGYRAWIKHFDSIWDKKISQITLSDLQYIFDHDKSGHGTKVHMKVLCSKIFEYAVIHQYISRDDNYTEYIKCGQAKESSKHYAFSMEEIKLLMNDNSDIAKIVLIYIFTGLRANELLNIPRKNIYIDSQCPYLITGSKTEAGKNRYIPIHPFIQPYVKSLLLKKGKRVIDVSYTNFKDKKFYSLMNDLNLNHTIHDTRDTFATLCQINNVDIFARKRVLGHKFKDITFDTYTDTIIENLYHEVLKIKIPAS
uniref:tyrosine-type recombinase/integrase n=1 Tax=Thomasclavelia sp. TaxID=3025757 RepID=UPI0025F37CE5